MIYILCLEKWQIVQKFIWRQQNYGLMPTVFPFEEGKWAATDRTSVKMLEPSPAMRGNSLHGPTEVVYHSI